MTPKQFHEVAGAFPHTELSTSYGEPAWKAFGKFFTRLRREDDSVVLGRVPIEEREVLCAADPGDISLHGALPELPVCPRAAEAAEGGRPAGLS